MRHPAVGGAFVLAGLLLAMASGAGARAETSPSNSSTDTSAEPLVTLVRSSTAYDLIEDGNTLILDVQVRLRNGLKREDLDVQVVDVLRGQARPSGLMGDFTASLEGTDVHPAIRLTVNAELGMQPATYDVVVDVARKGTDEATTLDFQLTHAAAAVPAPATLVVQRTLGFLFWRSTTDLPSLTIEETSGLTRLSRITVDQIGQGTNDGRQVGGRVSFVPPSSVDLGTAGTATLKVSGADYPLGTTTATAKIKAPQLQSPVQFTVEVHTRRNPVIILWVVALALLLGWFTRTFLQHLIDRGNARVAVLDLLNAMKREKESRKDDQFSEEVTRLESTLRPLLDRFKKVDDMTSAIAAAKPQFDKALADSETRRQDAWTKSQALLDLARPGSAMPLALDAPFAQARASVDTIRKHLAASEITAAGDEARTAQAKLTTALQGYVTQWKDRLTPLDTATSSPDPQRPLPRGAPRVSDGVKAMSDILASGMGGDSPDAAKLIAAAGSAYQVAKGVSVDLADVCTALSDALTVLGSPPPPTQSVEAARTKIAALEDLAQKFAQEPGGGSQGLADALAEALRSTGDAVEAQLPDGADRQPIRELISQGRYLDAANAAMRVVRPPTPAFDKEGGPLGEGFVPAVSGMGVTLERRGLAAFIAAFAGREIRADGGTALVTISQASPSVAILRVQTLRSLLLAKTAQLIVLGVLLLWAAWVLYSGTFVGTAKELATIFIWAFAIDLSVDAVTKLFPRPASGEGSAAGS